MAIAVQAPEPDDAATVRRLSGRGRLYPTIAHQHGGSKIGSWWTHELVGYALNRFHQTHMRTPTQNEVRAGLPEFPSYTAVKRLYGSFGAMLRSHGYRVRPSGGQAGAVRRKREERSRELRGDPDFGRVVQQLRRAQDFSQEQLAWRSQLTSNYVGGVERGEINPTLETLKQLAVGLGVSASQLLATAERLANERRAAASADK
jgi:XRE family transcriptional regulator, regulator of sulfur utilization